MGKPENSTEENLVVPDSIAAEFQKYGGTSGIKEKVQTNRIKRYLVIFKALSDSRRLKILETVSVIPSCACMLKKQINLSDSRLSYHINILKKAGLIEGEKEKNWIIYSLTKFGKKIHGMLNDFEI